MASLHTIPLAETPSGLPDGEDEISPLGVPEADPEDENGGENGEEMPGIPDNGEADTAG